MLWALYAIMRHIIIFISFSILLFSCVDYATVKAINTGNEKIALQDYYSPCCGSCGERIVIDHKNGQYSALQVNCSLENIYSAYCTPYRIGTQKQIMNYKKNKITSIVYYRPVYDTIELLKLYPTLKRQCYFDTALILKPILPLTQVDSFLITKYLQMTTKKSCRANYLNLIRGFVHVADDDMKYNKPQKIKFRARSKNKGS
jgi:hypothetical protein